MILQCQSGDHHNGKWQTDGKFIAGYIQTGVVLNAAVREIAVQNRLDDGKIQTEEWALSTNFRSNFL